MKLLSESSNLATPLSNFNSIRINGNFGDVRSTGIHKGTDFRVASGTKLYAIADGIVKYAQNDNGYCGGRIDVQHDEISLLTRYCHVREIVVNNNQKVSKGQLLGYSGGGKNDPNRGRSTGAHLHFAALKNGRFVDPMPILKNSKDSKDLFRGNTETKTYTPSGIKNTNFSLKPSTSTNPNFSLDVSTTTNPNFSLDVSTTTNPNFSLDVDTTTNPNFNLKKEEIEREINRIKILLK